MPTLRKIRRYGWHPSMPDPRDHFLALEPQCLTNLPTKVDLVDENMPPIWNQGELGSCTAHGTLAAVEYERCKQHGAGDAVAPSRLFQYYNSRLLEGTPDQDSGATCRDAVKATAVYGVLPETELAYDIKKFTVKPTAKMYDDAKQVMITKYSRVPQSITYIRAALAAGKCVIIGFSVFESFESDVVAKTGIVPMPNPDTEQLLGGHCVAVVGYDDTKRQWKVRNSWGADWGAKGYCYFPYALLTDKTLSDDFWTIDTSSK